MPDVHSTKRGPALLKRHLHVVVAAAIIGGLFASDASAQAPSLGAADSFAVLGASTVTNTGPTIIQGNLGLTPGSSVTGFPPGVVVNGAININNANATTAKTDAMAAFTALNALPCDVTFGAGQDLTALSPIGPGVYCFTSTAIQTGPVTLVTGGDPSDVVFKIASTLTVSNNATTTVAGGPACNVYWAIGSSATLGSNSTIAGSVLALTSITLNTGATASGGLFALNGAVTLDTNLVSACLACDPITLSPSALPSGTTGVPYSQIITASGGTAPYTFAVSAGALPSGLTLATDGEISGTPTQTGTFDLTITATDDDGCQAGEAVQSYALVVHGLATAIPAIDWLGMALMMVLLGASAIFVMNRLG